MFQGLRTVVLQVDDLEAAKAWYARATAVVPYFDAPFYVGFNIGGYELGLIPTEGERAPRGTAAVAYWGVADVPAAVAHLVSLGATVHEEPHDVGSGIVIGAVLDPFGHPFGVIMNPSFKPTEAA